MLTLLVCGVWARDEGFALLQRRASPRSLRWLEPHIATSRVCSAWSNGSLGRLGGSLSLGSLKQAVQLGQHQRAEMQLLDELVGLDHRRKLGGRLQRHGRCPAPA